MRKEIKPRFPESLEKLQKAVRAYGNNTRLSQLTGVSAQTLSKIADGTTKFPWAQTAEAIWRVLEESKVLAQPDQGESHRSVRRVVRPAHRQHGHISKRVRFRRYQVRVGEPL